MPQPEQEKTRPEIPCIAEQPRWAALACLGLCIALGACANPQSPAREALPDVYVWMIDTLRPDHLGVYGRSPSPSPEIDAFAADAVVFGYTYTPSPWTRPAVASLLTAVTPEVHGARGRSGVIAPGLTTWAEAMSALGYHTVALQTNPHLDARYGFDQGFARYERVQRDGEWVHEARYVLEDWLALEEFDPAAPRFHYLHSMDPHHPYAPELEHRRLFGVGSIDSSLVGNRLPRSPSAGVIDQARRLYDGEIHQNDAAFGEFVAELKRRGRYEDSWIVVLSDHGEEFWEHGRGGHGHGLWENLLRIPLIVKPPRGAKGSVGKALSARRGSGMNLHGVADLIGSRLSASWVSLCDQNAARLGLSPGQVRQWVSQGGGNASVVRTASVQLDDQSVWMVHRLGIKLVWRDRPEIRFEAYDLRSDPDEQNPLSREDWPAEAFAIESGLLGLAETVARGLELRYDGDGPGPRVLLRGNAGAREAWLFPGARSERFRLGSDRTELEWAPRPGDRLFLRPRSGARWTATAGRGRKMAVWPLGQERAGWIEGFSVRAREFGVSLESVAPADDAPEELREALRALGYID